MIGMARKLFHTSTILIALMLMLSVPAQARVTIMHQNQARALIGADGSEPVSLSTAQLVAALGSIQYSEESLFSSGDAKPVFSEQQIRRLAPQLQKALASIQPGEAVAFHQDKTWGAVFPSKGRLVWHLRRIESYPAFDLTIVAEEKAMMNHAITHVPEDDVDVFHWSLVPRQGQVLLRGRPDLLAIPIRTLTTAGNRPVQERHHTIAPLAWKRPDMDQRIDTLWRLLGKQLISREEYDAKLESMITEYVERHPSPEAGLEFLHMLDKKGLIKPAMLQRQRKLLLDRL